MEVLKSISPKKTLLGPFFSEASPRVHAIQLFFGIVLPHGNVDLHEYKLMI